MDLRKSSNNKQDKNYNILYNTVKITYNNTLNTEMIGIERRYSDLLIMGYNRYRLK